MIRTCIFCGHVNDTDSDNCKYCGLPIEGIVYQNGSTKAFPDEKLDGEPKSRWGLLDIDESETFKLVVLPSQDTLVIHLKRGERIILGRTVAEAQAELEDVATIEFASEGFRREMIELALLSAQERSRIEAIKAEENPRMVDLEPYEALDQGVSRRHAVIERDDFYLTITDLNSTNGTRLNNTKLVAYQRRVLRHEDEIQLGKLVLRIILSS